MSGHRRPAIAVTGIGCWYPGAPDPRHLWENILAKRREFRRYPSERASLQDYYHPDRDNPDMFYQPSVALVDGFAFDWASYRVPRATVLCTDVAQWLALEVATRAIADAGFTRDTIPGDTTGVFVGNTNTGEMTRSFNMRLRWPFVRRALDTAAEHIGLDPDRHEELTQVMERAYKSVLPQVTEDFGAGTIGATIAGRIANYFNFHGGHYVVDWACASSLMAVATACELLHQGRLDLALAGGVDVSLDAFEMVGFAKAGALTSSLITPFDARGSGFIAGEGSGVVVLKRLEDARAAGDYVYATIHGWGLSSDGRTGIMQPTEGGQATAIGRAYALADYDVCDVDFIEAHGTGTRRGDQTEVGGIAVALADGGGVAENAIGVTSVKSNIGHTKAAAGIAGLIKAVIAVNRRIVPPTASLRQPHPVFERIATGMFPVRYGEVRGPHTPLRAGVSAFGFGGANSHVTLQSGDAPSDRLAPTLDERTLLASHQDAEVFVFGGETLGELAAQLATVLGEAPRVSYSDLTDLAADHAARLTRGARLRAAVVASSPDELGARVDELRQCLGGQALQTQRCWSNADRDLWLGGHPSAPRIGYVFPGQGSQRLRMARTLVERHRWARELLTKADRWIADAGGSEVSSLFLADLDRGRSEDVQRWELALMRTQLAQPAICFASLLYLRFLTHLGIRPSVVGGHSLGELTALHAAGAYDTEALIKLAACRGQAMAADPDQPGAMLALACSAATAREVIAAVGSDVVVANINSPRQVVLSGAKTSVRRCIDAAADKGIAATPLRVSNAFHSLLVAGAASALDNVDFVPRPTTVLVPMVSAIAGEMITGQLDVQEYLVRQLQAQVDFVSATQTLQKQCDILLEVGPGRVLSRFIRDSLPEAALVCLPSEGEVDSHRDLCRLVACCYVAGVAVHWSALYEGRLVRPYVPPSRRLFIRNPLEEKMTPAESEDTSAEEVLESDRGRAAALPSRAVHLPAAADGAAAAVDLSSTVRRLVAGATGYTVDSISMDARMLEDLGLDSIKAGELVAEIARAADAAGQVEPARFANASLREIVAAVVEAGGGATRVVTAAAESAAAASRPHPAGPTSDQEQSLVDMVVARTGFPSSAVTLDSRLLEDLGLDSIKAGELVAQAAQALDAAGAVEPAQLANATLREVLDTIVEAGRTSAEPSAPPLTAPSPSPQGASTPSAPSPPGSDDVERLVLAQAMQITGFGPAAVSVSSHVLEDLELDRTALETLINDCAERLSLRTPPDVSALLDRTLGGLAALLGEQLRRAAAEPRSLATNSDQLDSWTRNYEVTVVPAPDRERPADSPDSPDRWANAQALVLAGPGEQVYARALADQLAVLGCVAEVHEFGPGAAVGDDRFSHIFAFLSVSGAPVEDVDDLAALYERLVIPAKCPTALPAPGRRVSLTWVQFGGGWFGAGSIPSLPSSATALAFARCVALERPDLAVRVVDVAPSLPVDRCADVVVREVAREGRLVIAGYDPDGVRRKPWLRLQRPSAYLPRAAALGADDVVLVTGGAKGIMAEAALALARATQARMVLVGSSEASAGGPQAPGRTVDRFREEGLDARYYRCDVTSADALEGLLDAIGKDVGRVTVVVHGASRITPRRSDDVTAEAAADEAAPKALGAVNLCRALARRPPRLLVGITSIIGSIRISQPMFVDAMP